MRKRDLLAGWAWALAIWSVAVNSPSSIWWVAMGTAGAISAVWDGVANILNSVAPTAFAWVAAPFASAASSAYLANTAMNIVWVENKIARGLALGWSAVLWYGAWSLAQPFLIGGAVVKWAWDIGRMAWNSEALRKIGSSRTKAA